MQATAQGGMHLCPALSRSRASWFGNKLQLMDRLMSATSSGAKFKLFGFLKGIFQKTDAESARSNEQPVSKLPAAPQPPPPVAKAKPVRSGNGNGVSSRQGASNISIC